MPDSPVIVAVDQGTSSTKCVVVDSERKVLGVDTAPVSQQHPRPGWVEQDAAEILRSVAEFTDKEIIPNAQALEHADAYPQ